MTRRSEVGTMTPQRASLRRLCSMALNSSYGTTLHALGSLTRGIRAV